MKILVTGGAGFIGSHLVERLINEDHYVVVVDDLSGGRISNLNEIAEYREGDCRNSEEMDEIFKDTRPEVVYHLAANAAENKAQFSPVDVTSRNYDAFIKVLTPFIKHGGKRFVFTSSIAVYGAGQTPFFESDTPDPEDLYGITKLAAERSLDVMSRVHGFNYVVARPHNVFGPRQNMSDPYRNVVTIWMNAILRDEPVYIYGDGQMKRQFSYIDTVTDQLYRCGFQHGVDEVFNLGEDTVYTVKDLFEAVQDVTGYDKPAVYLPARPQEVKEAIADHTHCEKVLGIKEHDLRASLAKTWEWCKTQGPQEPRYTKIEIPSEKLPKNWK